MPTECSAEHFDFGTVEGRAVEAAFDGGLVSSDAGALLLVATDRAIGLIDRFAACFHDERREDLIEHEVATLVGQRVFGIALGYEDLNDHDELRHDPLMAVLAATKWGQTATDRAHTKADIGVIVTLSSSEQSRFISYFLHHRPTGDQHVYLKNNQLRACKRGKIFFAALRGIEWVIFALKEREERGLQGDFAFQ